MTEFDVLSESCRLSREELEVFKRLWGFYSQEREKHNFTAIREQRDFVFKHFADSLLPDGKAFKLQDGFRVLDVGTGGGFPAIPLAVLHPKVDFFLLDANQKNIKLLEGLIAEFKLKNVNPVWARAEKAARLPEYREKFDLVLTRAFASWPALLEICLPFVKIGGGLAAYKGPKDFEAIKPLSKVVALLGGGKCNEWHYELPEDLGRRVLVLVSKIAATPEKYPRGASAIDKRSLHA